MVRIRGQKIRMKRQKKKYVIIGAGAVAVLAAVTLIAEGISYFSAETVDTKEGLAIIKAAEKEYIGFTIWCECENCHAQASGYCPDMKKEDTAIVNIDSCRNKAVEAWNRRANDGKIN